MTAAHIFKKNLTSFYSIQLESLNKNLEKRRIAIKINIKNNLITHYIKNFVWLFKKFTNFEDN